MRFLLDANIVRQVLKHHAGVRAQLRRHAEDELCVSALTEAELRHGLHKRDRPPRLTRDTEDFLSQIPILSWGSEEARIYGALKASQERMGKPLAIIDLLLAAHALSVDAVLVSDDHAFGQVPELRWENWLRA